MVADWRGRAIKAWLNATTVDRIKNAWGTNLGAMPVAARRKMPKKDLFKAFRHAVDARQPAVADFAVLQWLDPTAVVVGPAVGVAPAVAPAVAPVIAPVVAPVVPPLIAPAVPPPGSGAVPPQGISFDDLNHIRNVPNRWHNDEVNIINGKLDEYEEAMRREANVKSIRLFITPDHRIRLSNLGKPYKAGFRYRTLGEEYNCAALDCVIYIHWKSRWGYGAIVPGGQRVAENKLRTLNRLKTAERTNDVARQCRIQIYRDLLRQYNQVHGTRRRLGDHLDAPKVWAICLSNEEQLQVRQTTIARCRYCLHWRQQDADGRPAHIVENVITAFPDWPMAKRKERDVEEILKELFCTSDISQNLLQDIQGACRLIDPYSITVFHDAVPPYIAFAPHSGYRNIRGANRWNIPFRCTILKSGTPPDQRPTQPTSLHPKNAVQPDRLEEYELKLSWYAGIYRREGHDDRLYMRAATTDQAATEGKCGLLNLYDPKLFQGFKVNSITPVHTEYEIPDEWAEGTQVLLYKVEDRHIKLDEPGGVRRVVEFTLIEDQPSSNPPSSDHASDPASSGGPLSGPLSGSFPSTRSVVSSDGHVNVNTPETSRKRKTPDDDRDDSDAEVLPPEEGRRLHEQRMRRS